MRAPKKNALIKKKKIRAASKKNKGCLRAQKKKPFKKKGARCKNKKGQNPEGYNKNTSLQKRKKGLQKNKINKGQIRA